METPTIVRGRLRSIFDRWRSLSLVRKFALFLLVAGLAGWGMIAGHRWWTAWPARVILRAEGDHYPHCFSPDGATLLTRQIDPASLLLWDSQDGRKRATWPSPDGRLRFHSAYSPDGRTIASAWYVGHNPPTFSVDLIDAESGQVRSTFATSLGGFVGLRFLDDGQVVRLLSTGPTSKEVVDVEVASGKVIANRLLSSPTGPDVAVLSPDGRRMASVTQTRPSVLRIWDLDGDREVQSIPGWTKKLSSRALTFSPDGRAIAVGFDEGSIEIWDLASKSLRKALRGHSSNYGARTLTFSPDGETLASLGNFNKHVLSFDLLKVFIASASGDRDRVMQTELILLDVSSGRRLLFAKEAKQVVFSPDGRSIAASHEDGTVQIHDAPKPP